MISSCVSNLALRSDALHMSLDLAGADDPRRSCLCLLIAVRATRPPKKTRDSVRNSRCYFLREFLAIGSHEAVDVARHRLVRHGTIRRLALGLTGKDIDPMKSTLEIMKLAFSMKIYRSNVLPAASRRQAGPLPESPWKQWVMPKARGTTRGRAENRPQHP